MLKNYDLIGFIKDLLILLAQTRGIIILASYSYSYIN